MNARVLWLDLETDGSDVATCSILEVGLVVTEGIAGPDVDSLAVQILEDGCNPMAWPSEVFEMHHEHDIIRALVAEVRRLRPHGEPAHLVSAEWLEDVTSERDEARNAVRGMAARCWMLRQAARDSDSLARTVIAAREHHERHLRAQIATEIERHCLEDAFLEPDDLDNESKVCRYCHAAADIARGAA